MQTAVNNYSGSGGLVLQYNGTFDEQAILNNICGQWSKPKQELSISSGKNNITILGVDGSKANFGIRIKGTANNIIVRNMKIGLLPGGADNGDLIGIEADSHHVWIDHNELYTRNMKCPGTPDDDTTFDGMLDIKNQATFITVSYNYMHDHAKVGLIGSSDTDSAERRVTYAHNRYENLGSRLPFQRFGYVHSYNNYFNNITGSGINPRMGGHILVENNFFENALNPVFSQSTILGQWDLRNNNARSSADNATYNITWTACSGSTPCQKATNWTTTATFPITLPYSYTTYRARRFEVHRAECGGLGQGPAGGTGRARAPAVAEPTTSRSVNPTSISLGASASSSPRLRDRERELDRHRRSELAQHLADERHQQRQLLGECNRQHRHGEPQRHGDRDGGGITRTVGVSQAGTGNDQRRLSNRERHRRRRHGLREQQRRIQRHGLCECVGHRRLLAEQQRRRPRWRFEDAAHPVMRSARRPRAPDACVVNGVASNITFNGTGAWTTWATQNVTVTLNNNTTNIVRFESTGQDLANIDQIEIL